MGIGARTYRLAHHVWGRLPPETRRRLFYDVTGRLAPKPDRVPGPDAAPVTVAGLLTATTGLGQGARLSLAAFRDLGVDTRWADLAPSFDQSDLRDAPEWPGRPAAPGESGTLLVHVNGPYLPFALWRLGPQIVRRKRVVGFWFWELPAMPADWARGLRFVHEVWTSSQFSARSFGDTGGRPVRVVPLYLPPPPPPAFTRSDLGIPADALVTASFFHMGSSFSRKNPVASVHAFRKAFGDDPKRVLLLRVVEPHLAPWAQSLLADAIGGAGNIRLFKEKMSRAEITGLLEASDIVLSLHRSEGFGLVPAEAMQLGKVVVATGWSGNMDFMTPDNSIPVGYRLIPARDPQGTYDMSDQVWADADVEEAAAALRRLAGDPALRAGLGRTARADAARLFGPDAYAAALRGDASTLRAPADGAAAGAAPVA